MTDGRLLGAEAIMLQGAKLVISVLEDHQGKGIDPTDMNDIIALQEHRKRCCSLNQVTWVGPSSTDKHCLDATRFFRGKLDFKQQESRD